MNNKTAIIATVAAMSFGSAISANDQLIASAGLTAAEAEGLTLNQIVAVKYNRGRSFSERQVIVLVPSGDTAQVVENYNRGKGFNDRQPDPSSSGLKMSSRSPVDVDKHAQLIASAGLTSAEAEGLTLNQIVAAKYNRGRSFTDQQRVGRNY